MLLIHGAGGNRNELAPLARAMGPGLTYWSFDMLGHGGRPEPEAFVVPEIAEDLVRGLDRAGVERAFLCGYSFGGIIGFYLANHFADRVIGCCALGTKVRIDPQEVRRLLEMIDPERIERSGQKVTPELAAIHSKQRMLINAVDEHGGPEIIEKWLRGISGPVLALNGRADPLVSVEEAIRVMELVPNSRCVIFDGPAHPLKAVQLDLVAEMIWKFIRDVEDLGL